MTVEQQPRNEKQSPSTKEKLSPLIRRIADRMNIDLGEFSGTGSEGQITLNDLSPLISQKRDLIHSVKGKEPDSSKKDSPVKEDLNKIPEASDHEDYILAPLNHIRRITGEKLSASKRDIPHFYLSVDCKIDSLLNFKREYEKSEASSISINDLILYAVARTLKKHPVANASWSHEGIKIHRNVNLAVAVASDRGLLTPVIRNADSKGILSIASDMKELKQRAKKGELSREQLMGGTFSVSNLGMYGIQQAVAVINPPQACILAVGSAETKLLSQNNKILHASIMNCTLSSDHRVLDGAEASRLLANLKLFLEDPLQMLI
ncbi:MAG: dihydrolipoamide acetyltransferase family protein [SAR324 cluster bacterium]|nr:dihydrolipoamide acetyltransferase family protein [SAR324 cluster bacterium]